MRAIDGDAHRDRLRNLADDDWNQSTTTSWAEAFAECADMVDDAPTIEPEPHWIKCSERLPDSPIGPKDYYYEGNDIAADEYIVMIKDAEIPTSLYWTGDIWFLPNSIDGGIGYSVIAWMPLPEPYREGESC